MGPTILSNGENMYKRFSTDSSTDYSTFISLYTALPSSPAPDWMGDCL